MSVEFGGMGSMVVTMKAAAVTTGGIAGMDGNDTVRNANGGVAPVGVVLNKRNNHAAVQIRGYVRVIQRVPRPGAGVEPAGDRRSRGPAPGTDRGDGQSLPGGEPEHRGKNHGVVPVRRERRRDVWHISLRR